MTATAETFDYPIRNATALGGKTSTPTIQTTPLPNGSAGTFATLEAMAQCVRGEIPPDFSGADDPWVKETARQVAFGSSDSIQAIFDYVTNWIEYTPHPIDKQIVQDCQRTIEIGSGDCVSLSVCAATLLASLGYQVRFVAQYPSEDTGYSHVYCEAFDNGRWIAVDCVAKGKPLDWSQPLPDSGFETSFPIF